MFATLPLSSNVISQMNFADDVLKKLEKVLINPIIAGGAPRDWFFNKQCSDIDIFVDPCDLTAIDTEIKTIFREATLIQTGATLPEQYRSNYISAVITFKVQFHKVQIVIKNNTDNVLTHFPCSLSLITYKDFNLIPESIFINDLFNNWITFTKDCHQKYERKMLQKFPFRSLKYVESFSERLRQEGSVFDDEW